MPKHHSETSKAWNVAQVVSERVKGVWGKGKVKLQEMQPKKSLQARCCCPTWWCPDQYAPQLFPLPLLECNAECTRLLLLPWTVTRTKSARQLEPFNQICVSSILCQRCPINRRELRRIRGMAKSYLNNLFLKSTEMLLFLHGTDGISYKAQM